MIIVENLATRISGRGHLSKEHARRIFHGWFHENLKATRDNFSPSAVPSAFRRFWAALPNRHSLTSKIVFVGLVFSLVPVITYYRLDQADSEKTALLLNSAKEQGRLILIHLRPLLRQGLEKLPEIEKALKSLSNQNLNIRVLFQPKPPADRAGFYYGEFYYVAASPGLTDSYLKSEVNSLRDLGILPRLSSSCNEKETIGTRHAAGKNQPQLITAIVPLASKAGCWLIVTSYAGEEFLRSSFGRPYWQAPEIHFASIMYFSAAAITILVLVRIRGGLRIFRDIAVTFDRNFGAESFAKRNKNPDLDDVAVEFDRMVQRIGLLSFAVERSPSAISIANRLWRLEYVNPAYEKLSGKTNAQLIGEDLRYKEFNSFSDRSWFEICQEVERGHTWHGEIRRLRRDGLSLWANVSLYRMVTEEVGDVHFVCVQEDVTERKQMLDDLRAERDRAESLNQMKSNFVARMSHEFRTPLNAILGFSEVIASEAFGKCGVSKYIEYADNIHSSGHHLLSLINDVLDLSRLESGKEVLHPEPLDLNAAIREVLTLVENEARKGQVTLALGGSPSPAPFVADKRAIKQILLNLLSNGIKFTPAGGVVTVGCMARGDGKLILTVLDTGCGIDKAELSKVCEPYERADHAYVRNRLGTGLGLPIVKRLVEIQNGELEITSEVGVGTKVTVIFPDAR